MSYQILRLHTREIVDGYLAGASLFDLAIRFRSNDVYIRRILVEEGVTIRKPGPAPGRKRNATRYYV